MLKPSAVAVAYRYCCGVQGYSDRGIGAVAVHVMYVYSMVTVEYRDTLTEAVDTQRNNAW